MKQGKMDPNELLKSISMETTQKVSIVKQEKVAVDKPTKQQQPNKSYEQKRSPNISVTQKKENKSNKPQQVQKKSQ